MKNNQWHDFNEGVWQEQISVRDFILNNYTPFDEAPEFLQEPTDRTKRVYDVYESLRQQELNKGGVLDVDTETVSSLLTFEPGYLLKEDELIVGLQTDKP